MGRGVRSRHEQKEYPLPARCARRPPPQGGGDEKSCECAHIFPRSRGASSRPSYAASHATGKKALPTASQVKKGGGAPKGAKLRGRALPGPARAAHPDVLPSACAFRARSPFGAPPRRLPKRGRFGSIQAALHAIATRGRYPRRRPRLSKAPCAPVVMPAGSMPGPPGNGVTSPVRRNRPAPPIGCHRSTPFDGRDS